MRIEKISRTNPSSPDNDPSREQQRFESTREIDRKKTEYERFRRESGISKEDFNKQRNRARKIGFGAMLDDEMGKK